MQDYFINLDQITEKQFEGLFNIKRQNEISYDADDHTLMVISFEINPNLKRIIREGYTILDWFSDIGGLYGLAFTFASMTLSLINYNYLENYMVSKLYKTVRKGVKH